MDDELDPGNIRNTQPSNATPFVVALIGFLIVALLAFVYLREDGDLAVLRPAEVRLVDDTTLAVTGFFGPCQEVDRAQVDRDDDTVFVELIVRDLDRCDCDDDCSQEPYDLEIVLDQPVGDRRVVPGVGRLELPCDSSGTCRAER